MAASIISLGKITIAAAGTPVQILTPATIAALAASQQLGQGNVHAFLINVDPLNAANIYVGLSGMNRTTRVGVVTVLAKPSTTNNPSFSCAVTAGANALNLTDFWVDADSGGDAVIVSAIIW